MIKHHYIIKNYIYNGVGEIFGVLAPSKLVSNLFSYDCQLNSFNTRVMFLHCLPQSVI